MTTPRYWIGWVMTSTMAIGSAHAQSQQNTLPVYAAGSLGSAMTELARAFESQTPGKDKVALTLGPSGLLKTRIEAGEPAQVFASANMTHPQALHKSQRSEAVAPFARNALCALASPAFSLSGKTLGQRLLDDDVRVGTSTPKADPSGDYAFQMFERIESTGAAGPGSAAALKAKALQLTGGPNSPQAPAGRNLYGIMVSEGQADVFITYCTNATQAREQVPSLNVLKIPDAINVAATYGITIVKPATPSARAFVDFVLAPGGQKILATFGFSPP